MGPSGSGKSTLQKELGYRPIVTWTSRPKRDKEVHGKDYFFTTRDEILRMFNDGLLLEYTEYNGNLYGIGTQYINELIETKQKGSIVVDENGARLLKEKYKGNILLVGVTVPYEECKERLSRREDSNTESRLRNFDNEIRALMEISDIIIANTCANWKKTKEIIQMLKEGNN